jgi:hypothetical protein
LDSATETLRTAIERARHLMFELRPQVLGEQGLAAAVNGLLEEAAKDGGFTFTIESTVGRYTRAIENLCYRVIQEAVSNVKRHSQASTVTMEERNGDIACRVHDDGIGFDLERALDRDRMRLHLGLESMRERLTVSGGDLTITSSPAKEPRSASRFPSRPPLISLHGVSSCRWLGWSPDSHFIALIRADRLEVVDVKERTYPDGVQRGDPERVIGRVVGRPCHALDGCLDVSARILFRIGLGVGSASGSSDKSTAPSTVTGGAPTRRRPRRRRPRLGEKSATEVGGLKTSFGNGTWLVGR